MTTNNFTLENLKKELHYDPDTGIFTRLKSSHGKRAGDVAGSVHGNGYREIQVLGKKCMANRLAWFYMLGVWPAGKLDHKDEIKDNNRFLNLRDSTHSQNMHNRSLSKNNTSGYKGVTERNGAWEANCMFQGKNKYLGRFDSPEKAAQAYNTFASEHHGEFFNDGFGANILREQ